MAAEVIDEATHRQVTLPDGSRIAYTVFGSSGTPVVLVHGGAGGRRDWDEIAPLLALSHTVVAADMIGFGDSDRPPGKYGYARLAGSVLAVMDDLGIDRAHLVGHSLGGRVALEAAISRPDRVGGLLMIAPMGFGRLSVVGFLLGLAHWAAHRLTFSRLPYPDLDIEIDDRRLRGGVSVMPPTRVVWGSVDRFFPPRHAERVLAAIPGATAEIFQGCGHSPHRQAPDRFAATVLDFVKGPD